MEAAGKRYILYPSRSNWFTLWNVCDLHLGNAAVAKNRLRRDIAAIRKDPFSFWLSTGDNGEYISYRDRRRFDPSIVDPSLCIADMGNLGQVLSDRVYDTFDPIKDKCFGLGIGNHEAAYMRDKEQAGLHKDLCKKMGATNLAFSSFFDLVFIREPGIGKKPIYVGTEYPAGVKGSKSVFRVFTHHGAGWANTPGGKLNRLIKFMNDFAADIYMMGHVHDQKSHPKERVGANSACEKLTDKRTIGIISGAYLKTYAQGLTTYGEVRGYSPTTLGAGIAKIHPDTRTLKGEV